MELETWPAVDGSSERRPELRALLTKTSRTFALTIPMLPEPLQTQVAVAYLLFRIIDTFEDATRWDPPRRASALGVFARLMDGGQPADPSALAAEWLRDPPLEHEGYLELLRATPAVLDWHRALTPTAGVHLGRHVARSAREMIKVLEPREANGSLALRTLQDLREYCLAVAGIVGEMLTELFILQSPSLEAVAADLRARSIEFGEGLQLVNILKDANKDAGEGRSYLPRDVSLAEVFQLARADLRRAIEYIEALRAGGGAPGLVAFNAVNARLAIATLRLVRDKGPGAKLTRLQVTTMAGQVLQAVETGGPVFPESP